jgi:translation initiation factor eIF-2B subunit delta
VLICCETYKFHERVQLDAITNNELGDPRALVTVAGRSGPQVGLGGEGVGGLVLVKGGRAPGLGLAAWCMEVSNRCSRGSWRTGAAKRCPSSLGAQLQGQPACQPAPPRLVPPPPAPRQVLQGAAEALPRLGLLNLKYDAMPAEYVTMVVTEFGMIPPTSVPVILREYRQES